MENKTTNLASLDAALLKAHGVMALHFVESESDPRTGYFVILRFGVYECECPAYRKTGRACKHIVAVIGKERGVA